MATPSYLGTAQPTTGGGGWLGRFGSYFGNGGTPAYAGDGQPSSAASGSLLRGDAPAYKPAPVVKPEAPATEVSMDEAEPIDETSSMACLIDPEALAAGHIAIVIPRQGP